MENIRYLEPDTFDEIIKRIESAPGGTFKWWLAPALRAYWATGCRPAEIVGKNSRPEVRLSDGKVTQTGIQEHHGLRAGDVLPGHILYVAGKNTEGGRRKARKLKGGQVVCADSDTYREIRELADGLGQQQHIFGLGPNPRQVQGDGYWLLTRQVRKLRKRLPSNLVGFEVRWLRHSWAIHALRNRVDLVSVQRQLRHSRLEQTAQYLRFAPTDKDQIVRAFTHGNRTNIEARDCPSCGFAWKVDTQTGSMDVSDRAGAILKRRR